MKTNSKDKRKKEKIARYKPYFFENPKVKARLFEALRMSMPFESAARYAGISPRTLRKWRNMEIDDDTDPRVVEFYMDMQQIIAERIFHLLGHLFFRVDRWRASAWLLSRCHGYGKKGKRNFKKQSNHIEITFDKSM